MSCKPFETTEANAKSFLLTKGAVDKFLNVKDLGKFRTFHSTLKEQAKDQYFSNIPDWNEKLFLEEQGSRKIVPNKAVFRQIDKIIAIRKAVSEKQISKETSKILEREAKLAQIRDAKRAGIEYDEDYLFQENDAEKDSKPKVTVNELAKKTYFKTENERLSSDVLKEIANSDHPLNKLAKKLLPYVKLNDVTIRLTDEVYEFTKPNGETVRASGSYTGSENVIRLYNASTFGTAAFEKLILHEVLHAITYHHLKLNTGVNNDFKKLYEYAKEKIPNVKDTYAMNTLDEFIVGLFTDSKFIQELEKLPPMDMKKYDNLLQEIFDFFLSFLKLNPKSTLYSQAFDVATNVLEEFRIANEPAEYVASESYSNEQYESEIEFQNQLDELIRQGIIKSHCN